MQKSTGKRGGRAVLEVSEVDDEIKASVWNTGQGFTKEDGKSLFSKFSRLRNKTTQDKRGSGLGLFCASRFWNSMEGGFGLSLSQRSGPALASVSPENKIES